VTKVVTFNLPPPTAEKEYSQTIEQTKPTKNLPAATAPAVPFPSASELAAKKHQADLDKIRAIRSGKAIASALPVSAPIASVGSQKRESRPPPPSTAPPVSVVVETTAPHVVDETAGKIAKKNSSAAAALRGALSVLYGTHPI
jgi:hypothetical protein